LAPDLSLDTLAAAQERGQEGDLAAIVAETLSHRNSFAHAA
jgi:hypothetical protein